MDLSERVFLLLIGGGIGFILGYITRSLKRLEKEVHQVHLNNPPRNEKGAWQRPSFQNLSLILVVLMVAYAAFVSQVTSNKLEDRIQQDKIDRCQAGPESRNVTRELVEAVYNLATGSLVRRDPHAPPLTPQQVKQYNNYINDVNQFRSSMYDKIKPSPECAPYVDDDNVDPPSDPFPKLKVPKESS